MSLVRRCQTPGAGSGIGARVGSGDQTRRKTLLLHQFRTISIGFNTLSPERPILRNRPPGEGGVTIQKQT